MGVNDLTESVKVANVLEIRILAGERAVVGVQLDRPFQVVERLGRLPLRRERDGHDVMCVVAIGRVRQRAPKMVERRRCIPCIQRHCCGIHALLRRLRRCRSARRFALANPKVKHRALMQFALLGISLDDLSELVGGLLEIVTLQSANARFINRNRLVVPGLSWRRCRWAGNLWFKARDGCSRRSCRGRSPRGARTRAKSRLFADDTGRFLPRLFRHSVPRRLRWQTLLNSPENGQAPPCRTNRTMDIVGRTTYFLPATSLLYKLFVETLYLFASL
jgi:hypothetical protein